MKQSGLPRIALFAQDLAGGGAERMMVNLAGGIAAKGYPVDLVLVRREGPYLALVPPSVRIVELGTRRVVRSIPALARYLREERPAALLSTLVHVNVAAVIAGRLSRSGTRIVVREACHVSSARKLNRWFLGRVAYRLLPWAYRRADAVIGVSDGVADDLAEVCGLEPEAVYRIPNPVITPEIALKAAEHCDHPWLAPGQPPVILGVGRLTEQKDFAALIRAFAKVRRNRDARLVILGEGPLRSNLERLTHELGVEDAVSMPGFVTNPYAWMSRAAVFVLSSRFEGSPNSLVEAMACGTPVVATNCPSGPHEILQGGAIGALVEVGNSDAIAQAIVDCLDDPPDPNVLRERASYYSVDRVAEEYISVLLGSKAS